MKIVVAMKQVPDLTQIRIRDSRPVFDDAVYTYGDLDKNALEAAVQLKENGLDVEIIIVCVGDEELEETVKEALASGGDSAYLLCDDEFTSLDASQTAILLAEAIGEIGDVDLLLMGEGSGDNYSGQMVGRVAECLGWPQLGFAGKIEIDGEVIRVDRFLEDQIETMTATMPAVVSVVADINEIRIPAITQILKAGRKPMEVLDASDVEVELSDDVSIDVLSSLAPENNREGIIVDSIEELVALVKGKKLL